MVLAKIELRSRSSLADSVYQSVLEAILSGALAPGAELNEVVLAAELGVSRTPVHAALKRLILDGLAEPTTSRQARVARLGVAEVGEIYEMRLLLEPAAAERAATRLTLAALEALRDSASVLAASTASPTWSTRVVEFDIRFHDTLAAACGNERLHAEIRKYRHLVRALCRTTASPKNLQQAFHEHLRILDALEARDPQAARRTMTEHIEARLAAVRREIG